MTCNQRRQCAELMTRRNAVWNLPCEFSQCRPLISIFICTSATTSFLQFLLSFAGTSSKAPLAQWVTVRKRAMVQPFICSDTCVEDLVCNSVPPLETSLFKSNVTVMKIRLHFTAVCTSAFLCWVAVSDRILVVVGCYKFIHRYRFTIKHSVSDYQSIASYKKEIFVNQASHLAVPPATSHGVTTSALLLNKQNGV